MKRMNFVFLSLLLSAASLQAQPGGGGFPGGSTSSTGASTTYAYQTAINSHWSYDSTNKVYYIVGLFYCSKPAATGYEQMT